MIENSNQRKPTGVWGGRAIGKAINKPARATYWLLENGIIPARKVGRQWQTTDVEIEAFLKGEGGSVARCYRS